MNMQRVIRLLFRSPRRSIGTRLFLLFVCVVSVLVAAVGLWSYRISAASLLTQLHASSKQTIALTGEKLDLKMRVYDDLSNQLIHNNTFTEHLFQIVIPELREDERERRARSIQSQLEQLKLSDSGIRDITLIPLEDPIPAISTIKAGHADIDPSAPWLLQVKAARGNTVWLPPQAGGYFGHDGKTLFAYGKLLGRTNLGSHDFALIVQFDTAVLDAMIADVRLTPGAVTAIFGENGEPLAFNGGLAAVLPPWSPAWLDLPGHAESAEDRETETLYAFRVSPVNGWTVAGMAPLEELTGMIGKIGTVTGSVAAGSMAIALLIGLWLIGIFGLPLHQLEAVMSEAAQGNLTGRTRITGRDEIGRVAEAYDHMMDQIGGLIEGAGTIVNETTAAGRQIREAAAETAVSANEISAASGQIAQGAAELAAVAEHGGRRVEEMSGTLSHVLQLNHAMADSVQRVDHVCRESSETVRRLQQKTTETEQRIRTVNERIDGLQGIAGSIRELLGLMTSLSKRIKILSLNAAIEAARAGHAGLGFKVIADEIRALSDQSGASIEQADNLTTHIQSEVAETVQAMALAAPSFQDMISDVHNVRRIFEQIKEELAPVLIQSGDVSQALHRLEAVQTSLLSAIQEVTAVSEQSAASTKQVAAHCYTHSDIGEKLVGLSEKINALAGELERRMGRFRTARNH